MYIMKNIKEVHAKKTITCNRPIHIAHYSHNHLGLCRKHFAVASKITISGIEASFAVCIRSLGNLKLKKSNSHLQCLYCSF